MKTHGKMGIIKEIVSIIDRILLLPLKRNLNYGNDEKDLVIDFSFLKRTEKPSFDIFRMMMIPRFYT